MDHNDGIQLKIENSKNCKLDLIFARSALNHRFSKINGSKRAVILICRKRNMQKEILNIVSKNHAGLISIATIRSIFANKR